MVASVGVPVCVCRQPSAAAELLHPRVSLLTFTWAALGTLGTGYCAMGTLAIFCTTHYLKHGNIWVVSMLVLVEILDI